MPNAFAKIYVVTHIHSNTELLWPWSPGRTAKNTNCSYNSFLLKSICRFPSIIDSANLERDHKVPKQQPHGDHTASLHVVGYTLTNTHEHIFKSTLININSDAKPTHGQTTIKFRIIFLQKYINTYAYIWKYSNWCNFTHTDTCKHMRTLKNSGKHMPLFFSWNIKDDNNTSPVSELCALHTGQVREAEREHDKRANNPSVPRSEHPLPFVLTCPQGEAIGSALLNLENNAKPQPAPIPTPIRTYFSISPHLAIGSGRPVLQNNGKTAAQPAPIPFLPN